MNFLITQAFNFINAYNLQEPLHNYLRKEFQSRKQMGARDRRQIRELVYSWFRLGNALKDLPEEERLQAGFFLTHQADDLFSKRVLEQHSALQQHSTAMLLEDKMKVIKELYPEFNIKSIFPFTEWLSPLLNKEAFEKSFLVQPKVWIRVKPGAMEEVTAEFKTLNIPFISYAEFPNALSLEQGTKLEETKSFQSGLFEVQDLSSQLTGELFKPNPGEWWLDACAASGGKSLLLRSLEKNINITVSDSRSQALANLATRFKRAGISSYKTFIADFEKEIPAEFKPATFDGIIADVPCSGSGTWSRTPEQIQSFKRSSLDFYINKQRKIISQLLNLIKPGKPLIYITCSVFEEENEAAVEFFCSEYGFTLEKMQLIQGMERGADSLFAARMIRRS